MDIQAIGKCALCGGPTAPFRAVTRRTGRLYHACASCGFISLDSGERLSREAEKTRYLLHKNREEDEGYSEFLHEFIANAILPFMDPAKTPGARVLDFGSGPSPVLSGMFVRLGFECDRYDPFFARTSRWRERRYEAIALHEVAEHLRRPGRTLSALAERVADGGIIAIRTRFPPPRAEDFEAWWYRMDPTHVSFFPPSALDRFFRARGFMALALAEPDTAVFGKMSACADSSFGYY